MDLTRPRRVATAVSDDDALLLEPLFPAVLGAEPRVHEHGQPRGSGLGGRRRPVERSNAWVLASRRIALRDDRIGFVIRLLLQAACIWLVADWLVRESRQPALSRPAARPRWCRPAAAG